MKNNLEGNIDRYNQILYIVELYIMSYHFYYSTFKKEIIASRPTIL